MTENNDGEKESVYTPLQGQDLAFIYYYPKLHGEAPSERDMEWYFKVTPPAVHQMVLTLAKKGFIIRVPGAARSISLRLMRSELPAGMKVSIHPRPKPEGTPELSE